jgi:hypothetical protein
MWRALPALILLPSRSLSLSIFLSLSSLFLLPSLDFSKFLERGARERERERWAHDAGS